MLERSLPHRALGSLWISLAAAALSLATPTLAADHPGLKDPSKANETAPATFTAKFETTKGDVLIDCTRDWAPHGVDRFYNLVKIGFFEDIALFRVMPGFVVQWGIHGDPEVSRVWRDANLPADPVKQSNTPGMVSFAMSGNSNLTRTTQLFINYGNNTNLDGTKFSPICKVSEGMDIAKSFNAEYGPNPSNAQMQIQSQGNAFLKEKFPNLDYIKKASIIKEGDKVAPAEKAPDTGDQAGRAAPEEKDGTSTYILVGLLAVGALVAFLFMRGSSEPESPPPPTRPRKKAVSKKKTTSATRSKNDTSTTNTKRKKKKKRAPK